MTNSKKSFGNVFRNIVSTDNSIFQSLIRSLKVLRVRDRKGLWGFTLGAFIILYIGVAVSCEITWLFNPIRLFESNNEYTFFSSGDKQNTGSTYHALGNLVESQINKSNEHFWRFWDHTIEVTRGKHDENKEEHSTGALENAISVIKTPKSFGIIQEDTLENAGFDGKMLQVIARLYQERLHFVVRSESADLPKTFSLPSENSFFENFKGKICTGPNNSGASIIAPYVMGVLGGKSNILSTHPITNIKMFKDVCGESKEEKRAESNEEQCDAFMYISGSPLKDLISALKNKKCKLIGIDPLVVPTLNKDHAMNLSVSRFGNEYGDSYEGITTIGVNAILVGSLDITDNEKIDFLKIIQEGLKRIEKEAQRDLFPQEFPMELDGTLVALEATTDKQIIASVRVAISTIVSIATALFSIYLIFLSLSSELKVIDHYTKMLLCYQTILQKMDPLNPSDNNKTAVPSDVADQIKAMQELAKTIRKEYELGGMLTKHHNFLMSHLNSIYEFIQNRYSQWLHYYYADVEKTSDKESVSRFLREWLKKDYLSRDGYAFVLDNLSNSKKRSSPR